MQPVEFIASMKWDMAKSQECIASLRGDNDALRAALAFGGSSAAPDTVTDTSALCAMVHELDKFIQYMDSST